MTLTDDVARITGAVQARMERGWIDGDPATITIRPMMTRYRSYIVHFRGVDGLHRWLVDATEPGIVENVTGFIAHVSGFCRFAGFIDDTAGEERLFRH